MALADASGESSIPILAPTKVHLVSPGPSAASHTPTARAPPPPPTAGGREAPPGGGWGRGAVGGGGGGGGGRRGVWGSRGARADEMNLCRS